MTVLTFPSKPQGRIARLESDEGRLRAWYDSLDWRAQDDWYTLHELRAATGIPMARLSTVLWRCGWISQRRRGFHLTVWHGPHGSEVS
jgi:hypothetical protein